jgi:S1-C subfamily serine protease
MVFTMTKIRAVASLMAAVALLAGCGAIDDVLERFRVSSKPVATPDPANADHPVVETVRPSVVKVRSPAASCQKMLEGSGFVAAPNRVITNAHVVAGSDSSSVDVGGTTFDAQVVSYDPTADIAFLDVPKLSAPPLTFAGYAAKVGTEALLLGYPYGESFAVTPARIREIIELNGPDVYHTTTVSREVYMIDGSFAETGGSGGPLIDMQGRVLGTFFGTAADDPRTGFAISSAEITGHMSKVDNTQPVDTGDCRS